MQKKIRFMMLLCVIAVISLFITEEAKAAQSYTDPKTFFDTCNNKETHAEFTDGNIYYATKGRTAPSNGVTRFRTLGFQITATGNGASMSIDVKRGGTYLKDVAGDCVYYDGTYNLYKISYNDIVSLMSAKDANTWAIIQQGGAVTFKMDAIMTMVPAGSNTPNSSVVAESNGYLSFSNPSATYYIGTPEGLAAMEGTFGLGTFKYYKNIRQRLDNYSLVAYYYAGADGVTSSKGYKIDGNQLICYSNGSAYATAGNRFSFMKLPDPVADLGLYKEGYAPKKGREWINYNNSAGFSPTWYYVPYLNSGVNYGSTYSTFYVNWQPLTYYIQYLNANTDASTATYGALQTMVYGQTYRIYDQMFYSEKYNFVGWNTDKDGYGKRYSPNDLVTNLSKTEGEYISLYAEWDPKVFKISVDQNGGTGGTEEFYVKYKTRFMLKEDDTSETRIITPPGGKRGYSFGGYYTSPYLRNEMIVDPNGTIVAENDFYVMDDTVFAWWDPNIYRITLHQEGGINGSTGTDVTFDSYPPSNLDAPKKQGYTFMGYYTQPNGKGDCYYNSYMAPLKLYQVDDDIDLYAYWVDDIKPQAKLYIPDDWSNKESGIDVTGYVKDEGSGLQKVVVYLELSNNDQVVKTYNNLNGKKELTIDGISHTTEGAFVYRMEVWDMAMNVNETSVRVYKPAKYDITAPTGKVNSSTSLKDLINSYLEVYTTDYKTN